MEIYKNNVFNLEDFGALPKGLYRILEVLSPNYIILFPLDYPEKIKRPIAIDIHEFESAVKNNRAVKSLYSLPSYIHLDNSEIVEKYKEIRNKNYKLIEQLIQSQSFLFEYAISRRTSKLSEYANRIGKERNFIAKLLNTYWRLGQDRNTLLPGYANCGAAGSERNVGAKPIGAPKKSRTLAVQIDDIYVLASDDKKYIKKAILKYHLKPDGINLNKTYKEMLRHYYSEEITRANALGIAPRVPSYRQVYYWKRKFFSADTLVKNTSKRDYELNRRALLGSSKYKWSSPGNCYEIDATVADVHIVSEFNHQKILGRPTIYSIVDRGSAMIVGLHVSLYYASWRAARQALANALLPKSEFCKEYSIDIVDSDWPSSHIPLRLMCDNGEMIGLKPQEVLVPMMEMQFSPPYRPDFKAFVERRFGLLNDEVIHELLGSTKGGKVVRGSRDPRKDAVYTLKEFTALLIDAVLQLNNTDYESLGRASSLLIENDLAPTPLNYWKIHVVNHQHSLKISDFNDVVGRIYPRADAYMTREGIEYNGMYYFNDEVVVNNLAAIARTDGRLKLDARIDENTTNHIFVRLPDRVEFIRCHLSDKSHYLKDRPMVESDYVLDWLHDSKTRKPVNIESIETSKRKGNLSAFVKSRAKSKDHTFSRKISQIRENRKEEITRTTNSPVKGEEVVSNKIISTQSSDVYYLPRRKKE